VTLNRPVPGSAELSAGRSFAKLIASTRQLRAQGARPGIARLLFSPGTDRCERLAPRPLVALAAAAAFPEGDRGPPHHVRF